MMSLLYLRTIAVFSELLQYMWPYNLHPVQGQNCAASGDNAASGDKAGFRAREEECRVLK